MTRLREFHSSLSSKSPAINSPGAHAPVIPSAAEGQADVAATMKAYVDVGFEGPMCPDHIIRTDSDTDWSHRYWAWEVGHVRGLEAGIG